MLDRQAHRENLYRIYLESVKIKSDFEYAKNSYQRYHERLVSMSLMSGVTVMSLAGMVAALSPNTAENENFRDVWRLTEARHTGNFHTVRVLSYPRNKRKAVQILQGGAPLDVLRGKKVTSFYHNLLDPIDNYHVTVDGHMYNMWMGRYRPLKEARVTSRIYDQIADDIRALSSTVDLLPCEFQAVTWYAWKRIHRVRYSAQTAFEFPSWSKVG